MWYVLLSILCGLLYFMGGQGDTGRKNFPWLPSWFFNTKARDIGCSICTSVGAGLLVGITAPWYIHLLCFLMLFGALTTYWDFLFGFDNHWVHGFMCGVAYLPYALYTGDWWQTIARCVALAVIMGLISLLTGKDYIEEPGRGASLIATLPLLLI